MHKNVYIYTYYIMYKVKNILINNLSIRATLENSFQHKEQRTFL